jgi:hypothetical protein
MLGNQTGGVSNRRVLRTNTDVSLIKKSKATKQKDLPRRRKLRSSNSDSTENKSRQRQTSIKKERKKRMKKVINQQQETTVTRSNEPKTNTGN